MSLKTLFIIALILFFVPIILGKVDATQAGMLFKDPKQLTDTRILKLVFGDLIKSVIGYYKNVGTDLLKKLFGEAKKGIENKELEIKIK